MLWVDEHSERRIASSSCSESKDAAAPATLASPTFTDLLRAWEAGVGERPYQRGLTLLAAATPGCSRDELARWPIGKRDSCLLALRKMLFGAELMSVVRCPACGASLELTIPVETLRDAYSEGEVITLEVDEPDRRFELSLRPPNTRDVEAVVAASLSQLQGQAALLARCLVTATCNGLPCEVASLPSVVVDAAARALAKADPVADLQLALSCPECTHAWDVPLDIAAYLWQEVDRWAWRTLSEVHTLARAYGWSEAEILGMSDVRRRRYLEMVIE